MAYYDFGEKLKKLRKSKNMTQTELGRFFDLSKAVVSKYENSLGYPTYDTLISIARHFGVSTDYLLGIKSSDNIIDVTGLTENQLDIVKKIIEEFKKNN